MTGFRGALEPLLGTQKIQVDNNNRGVTRSKGDMAMKNMMAGRAGSVLYSSSSVLRVSHVWMCLKTMLLALASAIGCLVSIAQADTYVTTPNLRTWSPDAAIQIMADNTAGSGSTITDGKIRFKVGKITGTFSSAGIFKIIRTDTSEVLASIPYAAGISETGWTTINVPTPFPVSPAYIWFSALRYDTNGNIDNNVYSGVISIQKQVVNQPPAISGASAQLGGGVISGAFTVTDPEHDLLRDLRIEFSRQQLFPSNASCSVAPSMLFSNNQGEPNGQKQFSVSNSTCPNLIGAAGNIYYRIFAYDVNFNATVSPPYFVWDPGNQSPTVSNVVATINANQSLTVTAFVSDTENNPFRIVGTISNPTVPFNTTYTGRENTARCLPAGCGATFTQANGTQSLTWPAADVAAFMQSGSSYKVRVQAYDATTVNPGEDTSNTVTITSTVPSGPRVTSVSPLAARLDIRTTFTVTGDSLTSGMGFAVEDCANVTEEAGGSSTSRRFSCDPLVPGSKALVVKTAPGGTLLFSQSVKVDHPARLGNVAARGIPVVQGVSLFNGNFHMQTTDLSVPGKGLSFALTRSYNSYNWPYEAEHGGVARDAPWRFNVESHIGYVPNTANKRIYIEREDGSGEGYYLAADNKWYPVDMGNFSRLQVNGDGTWSLVTRGQLIYTYESPTAMGRLLRIKNRDGEQLTFNYGANNLLSQVIDASGRAYTFSYDPYGRISQVADFTGRYVAYTYTTVAGGRIASFRDVRGKTTHYTYGTLGFLESIIDPRLNTVLTLTYADVYGNKGVQSLTTAVGRATGGRTCGGSTVFTYCYSYAALPNAAGFTATVDGPEKPAILKVDFDNAGRPIAVTDGQYNTRQTDFLNPTDSKNYTQSNLPSQIKTPLGVADNYGTTIRYNAAYGLEESVTDALDQTGSKEWNLNTADNLFTVAKKISPLTHTTALGYTASGRVNRIVGAAAYAQSGINGSATQIGWTGGTVTSVTDPLNRTTTLERDAHGNLTGISDPRNAAWWTRLEYDPLGRVTKVTDPRGGVTRYAYDEAGNLLEERRELLGSPDLVTTYTYDENGNLKTQKDPRNSTVTYTYDAGNRLVSTSRVVSGRTVVTSLGYDNASRVASVTNANGHTSSNTYDDAGRLSQEKRPLSRTTSNAYDADGNLVSRTDGEGRTVTYEYDRVGRVVSVTDPLNNVQRYEYDPDGRLSKFTDAEGHITRYSYDPSGNLTSVTDANGVVSSAQYDAADRLRYRIDPRGKTTQFEYDEVGNLVKETDAKGNVWRYEYDAANNRTRATNPDGRIIDYTYDALNRLTRTHYSNNTNVDLTYDGNDNIVQMVDAIGTSTYQYDEANRLKQMTDPFGNVLAYAYDDEGNRTAVTYPGNRVVNYGYDAAERMQTVRDWTSRTATYSWNRADQVTYLQHGNGTTASYSYDGAGRLTNLTNKLANGSVISSHAFTLDKFGNITQADEILPLQPTLTPKIKRWSVDDVNRLVTDTISGDGFQYDAAGRLTRQIMGGQATDLAYNDLDQLTGLSTVGRAESYRYNGHGHRLERTVNGTTTRYLVEPNGDMPNVLAELTGGNVAQRFYVHGADGLLAQIDAAGNYHAYHYAPLGHTTALTDGAGNLSDSYAYLPSGATFAASGNPTTNPFRYVGRQGVMDDGNGMQYMRARYYAPGVTRFLSLDSVAGSLGEPQGLNRYAYAWGNPLTGTDPSGLCDSSHASCPGSVPEIPPWVDVTRTVFDVLSSGEIKMTQTVTKYERIWKTVRSFNYSTGRAASNKVRVWKKTVENVTEKTSVISDASKLATVMKVAGVGLDMVSAGQAMSKGEGDWASFSAETGISLMSVALAPVGAAKLGVDAGALGASLATGGRVPSDLTSRAVRLYTSEKAQDAYSDSAIAYLTCEGVPVECLYDPSQCGIGKIDWYLGTLAAVLGYRDPNSNCTK